MKLHGDLKLMLVVSVLCAVAPVFAQTAPGARDGGPGVSLQNLEQGIASPLDDAEVLPAGNLQLQGGLAWGSADRGDWRAFRTQLSLGIDGDWQATAGLLNKSNDLDETGDGDLFLKLMYQAHDTEQDGLLFGVLANFPTGQDYARIDRTFPPFRFVVNERQDEVDLGLLGVYTLVLNDAKSKRLHLEMRETLVNSAPLGFADTQAFVGLGYDQMVRENVMALASVHWLEGANACNQASSVLEFGLRRQISPRFLWGAGVAIGLDWPAADWGLTWGAQYGL
jgi:hypothetical protein